MTELETDCAEFGVEIAYYEAPHGNFGDDLNRVIWPRVFPKQFRARPRTLLVGIGTILNSNILPENRTRDRNVFVLGSGVGYGPLPPQDELDTWEVISVRGPLTAQVVGKADVAITDPAILLADLFPRSSMPRGEYTLFIPHISSLPHADWERIAARAEMRMLDPRLPVDCVVRQIAGARLVVTEAMHGAIVADTMRVPWVPVSLSPETLPFKWVDWSLSMQVPYLPISIPPTSIQDRIRHRRIRLKVPYASDAHSNGPFDPSVLIDQYLKREAYRSLTPTHVTRDGQSSLAHVARKTIAAIPQPLAVGVTRTLRAAASEAGYLSDERVYLDRLERMRNAVQEFVKRCME